MANIGPNLSSNKSLNKPQQLERSHSSSNIKQDSSPEIGKQRAEGKLRRTDSSYVPKLSTPSKDTLSDTSVSQKVDVKLESIASQALLKKTAFVPTPGSLLKARSELKSTATVEKTGFDSASKQYIQDSQHMSNHAPTIKQVQPVHTDMSEQAMGQAIEGLRTPGFRQADQDYSRHLIIAERQLPQSFNEQFDAVFSTYDKATNHTLLSSQAKQTAEQSVMNSALNWARGLGSDSDLGMTLARKSDGELRDLAARMLAENKGYGPKEMSKLSERKERFLDAMVKGLRQGINEATPGQPGQMAGALTRVTQELSQSIKNLPKTAPLRNELMFRNDRQVLIALQNKLGVKDASMCSALLNGVNQGLGGEVAQTRVQPTDAPNDVEVPTTVTINDKTYHAPKYLAAGGFAHIIRYENTTDPNDKIVLKQLMFDKDAENPSEHAELKRSEMIGEVRAQMDIEGVNGHRNLNHLEGVIRGSDNQVYVMQEYAGGGDLHKLNQKLWDAREQGHLDAETHQLLGLYITKGVLQGMEHIQNERQGHHFDLKLPNVLLSDTGVVKITDFGFSGLGEGRELSRLQGNDNPLYKSPELIDTENNYKKDVIDAHLRTRFGIKTFAKVKGPNEPKKPENLNDVQAMQTYTQKLNDYNDHKLYSRLYEQAEKQGVGSEDPSVTNRADTWNAGIMAYSLLKHRSPKTSHEMWAPSFSFQVEQNVIGFGQDSNNRVMPSGQINTGSQGLGVSGIDKLINGLMHPEAEKRTNFSSALQHSLFQDPRIEKPALRQLAMLIATGNPQDPGFKDQVELLSKAIKR